MHAATAAAAEPPTHAPDSPRSSRELPTPLASRRSARKKAMRLRHSRDVSGHPQASLSGAFERETALWTVRRWLELRGTVLTYKHSRSAAAQWTVDVRECSISAGKRAREIVIDRHATDTHPLHLFAPSLDELKIWFVELLRVSENVRNHYHVCARISHSVIGSVYLGRDRETEERVAIHCGNKHRLGTWRSNALSERDDAIIAATHKASAAVTVIDVFETLHTVYTVTELVTGATLDKIWEAAQTSALRSDVHTGRRLARNLLSVLAVLHGVGVVHGSVDEFHVHSAAAAQASSTNAAAATATAFKLLVYGSARRAATPELGSRARAVVGDAPEVLCFGRSSKSSDVFAVGRLVFRTVFGREPFCTRSEGEFLSDVERGAFDHGDGFGDGGAHDAAMRAAARLTARMLRADCEMRPDVRECLDDEWLADGDADGADEAVRKRMFGRTGSDPKSVITDLERCAPAPAQGVRATRDLSFVDMSSSDSSSSCS